MIIMIAKRRSELGELRRAIDFTYEPHVLRYMKRMEILKHAVLSRTGPEGTMLLDLDGENDVVINIDQLCMFEFFSEYKSTYNKDTDTYEV